MDKNDVLASYFGYSAFRDGQGELADAIISGRDVYGVMPTGSGKSICYQVPAIVMDGITFVISPLISLMKDQVAALRLRGIKAAYINSTLTAKQLDTVYRNLRAGDYKIVYIAPERLRSGGFIAIAAALRIALVAVDEAHCISQWGHDFRPDYLKVKEFIEALPSRPVLAAFTATATKQVSGDIVRILELDNPLCLTTGFDRPNLSFNVYVPTNKLSALIRIAVGYGTGSGIIYCNTRRAVERVCGDLNAAGIPATRYHAGLEDDERRNNQDDFLDDRKRVMVATNAFGMGINKPNVRYVLHYNLPLSLEAYYQEAGRAGRDGKSSDCILLFSHDDVLTAKKMVAEKSSDGYIGDKERRRIARRDFRRLREMIGYCRTPECLRGYILDYFGQSHERHCSNCSNCRY